MTDFETRYLWLVLLGLIVNGVGLVFVAVQVGLARREASRSAQAAEDELRRKRRQATLDFYSNTIDARRSREGLPADSDAGAIASVVERLQRGGEEDLRRLVASRLAYHEMLAAGVKTQIFDLEVVDRLTGARVINLFENYYPWIEDRRVHYGRDNLYSELQWLAESLGARRGRSLNVTTSGTESTDRNLGPTGT